MSTRNFSIIGGGIAGLAASLAVAKAEASVQIFEKTRVFEHVGAGLQLGPNAARALRELGAWEAILPFAYAPPEIHIRSGVTGKILKRLKLGPVFEGKFGAPYRVAHRADLHGALLSVVNSRSAIQLQMGIEADSNVVSGQAPVLAADGIWSQTRAQVFPDAKVVKLNDVIYRSLNDIPMAAGQVALDCVNLWLFPGGHVVHYPVGNPQRLNLVAVTQGAMPLEHFRTAAFDLQLLLAAVDDWTTWPAAYVSGLDHWAKGDILLLGDAAHGTVPYLAQGAAMALEDAALLGQLLSGAMDVAESFRAFENARHPRCVRLDQQSRGNGLIYHAAGPLAVARDLALRFSPAQLIAGRQDWIYSGP